MSADDLARLHAGAAPTAGPAPTYAPARPAPPVRPVQPAAPVEPSGAGGGPGGPRTGVGPAGPGGGQPPKKRHPVRTTLAILVVLVAASLVWLVAVPVIAFSTTPSTTSSPEGRRPGNQPGTTYLLVGSDSREGLTDEERKRLGTGSVGGQRTDTMMILYVPPGGKPALISIPRDSYVPIPGHDSNKINAAFSFGGAPLLVQTIEQNTGIRIDKYVEIGFGGFVEIVDAVGGVDVCLKKAIKDKNSHLDLKAGCQTLNGVNALGYARMRYADPRGDLGRVERQRQVVAAIAKKAATPATVVNPVRYWRLNQAAAGALAFGDGTGVTSMPTMGLAMMKISQGTGLTLTIPISNPNLATPAGSAVQWDPDKSAELFTAVQRGNAAALEQFAEKQ